MHTRLLICISVVLLSVAAYKTTQLNRERSSFLSARFRPGQGTTDASPVTITEMPLGHCMQPIGRVTRSARVLLQTRPGGSRYRQTGTRTKVIPVSVTSGWPIFNSVQRLSLRGGHSRTSIRSTRRVVRERCAAGGGQISAGGRCVAARSAGGRLLLSRRRGRSGGLGGCGAGAKSSNC